MGGLSIGRVVSVVTTVIVIVAIWKVNDGDLGRIVDAIWTFINWGADTVSGLWEKFVSSGQTQAVISHPAGK